MPTIRAVDVIAVIVDLLGDRRSVRFVLGIRIFASHQCDGDKQYP
jgi:hypothetical protein